jgi:hypothetical protein
MLCRLCTLLLLTRWGCARCVGSLWTLAPGSRTGSRREVPEPGTRRGVPGDAAPPAQRLWTRKSERLRVLAAVAVCRPLFPPHPVVKLLRGWFARGRSGCGRPSRCGGLRGGRSGCRAGSRAIHSGEGRVYPVDDLPLQVQCLVRSGCWCRRLRFGRGGRRLRFERRDCRLRIGWRDRRRRVGWRDRRRLPAAVGWLGRRFLLGGPGRPAKTLL